MPESNKVVFEIDESVTVDTVWYVPAGREMAFTLNGDGVWEFDESGNNDWVAFSGGSGKNFKARIPGSGKVRVNVTSGTCVCKAFTTNG